ncbi:hypothetical protein [Kordiimonas gwangyangensis]|uniref:hypothetical protein n=1 Tax=Kordiimonas gwangyangensis TaxID=288022 RepID=UPI00037F8A03|nr:hypothetical protein [Kordiimonas gwangyangensis]
MVTRFLGKLSIGAMFLAAACAAEPYNPTSSAPELHFSVTEGNIYNEFYRDGPVAAHTVLTSGTKPRLIVAYPAGNSGVSLWFREAGAAVKWAKPQAMKPVTESSETGPLHGVEMMLSLHASELTLEKAVLGNIRTIRTYLHERTVDPRVATPLTRDGDSLIWQRRRLDGKGGYKIRLDPMGGTTAIVDGGAVTLKAGMDDRISFHLTALSGDEPLTPIGKDEMLRPRAAKDELSRNILAFLSYKEKLLAGSWRFNTYFGRDTLLTTALLMPVLEDQVTEAALGSVMQRLAPSGEVAHEEDIGEFAVLRQLDGGGNAEAKPVYDYAMVDEDYMLAPVLAQYARSQGGVTKVKLLLTQKTSAGETYGAALMRNIALVIASATPFAEAPTASNLIAIEDGMRVGEWRDSQEGLGNGRYAYNVNAVLVPAALEAIATLDAAGVLTPFTGGTDLSKAKAYADTWVAEAPKLFDVSISADIARKEINAYADTQGVPAADALEFVHEAGVTFPALSLDADGRPIPVLQSDPGFMLFLRDPAPEVLERSLEEIMHPFPAGLMTPVGMVVANPVYADDALEAIFTKGHYHGPVVWPWQQAMMAAGLKRQLEREDLPVNLREKLKAYQKELWKVIGAGHDVKTAELWSWEFRDGAYHAAAYGQGKGHLTESNAAQLWSTVYLAVQHQTAAQKED